MDDHRSQFAIGADQRGAASDVQPDLGLFTRLAARILWPKREEPAPAVLADQVTVLGIPNARFWADSQGGALVVEAYQGSLNQVDQGELVSIMAGLERANRRLALGNQADPREALLTILDCAERLEDFAARILGDEARAEHARRVPAKYTPQNFRRWAREWNCRLLSNERWRQHASKK
jgi:hypothetical protein